MVRTLELTTICTLHVSGCLEGMVGPTHVAARLRDSLFRNSHNDLHSCRPARGRPRFILREPLGFLRALSLPKKRAAGNHLLMGRPRGGRRGETGALRTLSLALQGIRIWRRSRTSCLDRGHSCPPHGGRSEENERTGMSAVHPNRAPLTLVPIPRFSRCMGCCCDFSMWRHAGSASRCARQVAAFDNREPPLPGPRTFLSASWRSRRKIRADGNVRGPGEAALQQRSGMFPTRFADGGWRLARAVPGSIGGWSGSVSCGVEHGAGMIFVTISIV